MTVVALAAPTAHHPSVQEATAPDLALPWSRSHASADQPVPCLVLVWSLDEPDRVGELVPVTEPCCFGRGEGLSDDPAPRVIPIRVRPGIRVPCPPVGNARVSRVQWVLSPLEGGRIALRSVGRTPTSVNGKTVQEATLQPNDVVELRNAAVYLVVERRVRLGALRSGETPTFPFGGPDAHGIVGESEIAWRLRDELAFAAQSNRHALLLGPSGTGKELAARAIHASSVRGAKPFVARNASTLPEGLVDAELFGSARNYPNAGMPERLGLLGEADGSTLFLDEIGDLPERLQVHLLRALDADGEYQRLGESKVRRSSFRLVAATNRPLSSLKHDFLARFTHRIAIPSVDERREDLPHLAYAMLCRAASADERLARRFFERRSGALAEARMTPALVTRLVRHRYAANVRELDRLLWTAIGSAREDFLDLSDAVVTELGPELDESPVVEAAEITLEAVKRALDDHGGSVSAAARALGLRNRFVLHRLMKKFQLGTDEDDA